MTPTKDIEDINDIKKMVNLFYGKVRKDVLIGPIFNDAKTIGVIKEAQYPFGRGKYEVLSGKGRKLALSLQQIKQIINFTDDFEATERYRDMWFFPICVMVSM